MDVGKTKLPLPLLSKSDQYTDEQKQSMQRHVKWSLEILKQTPGISDEILAIAATHHERYDGSGYPKALSGNKIPVFGRIAGIVDCYDAMTSQRQFGQTVSPLDAMSELTKLADRDFQAEMIEKFIQAIGIFPSGTLVELNTGEVGVVIAQSKTRRLRPRLMLVRSAAGQMLDKPGLLDLETLPAEKSFDGAVWIVKGLEAGAFGINPSDYFLPAVGVEIKSAVA